MPRPSKSVNNPAFLEAALEGLELQKSRIEEQIREVRALLGRRGAGGARTAQADVAAPAPRRRRLSAAARKRIAAAQKRRWAEYRKGAAAPQAKKAAKAE